MKKTPGRDRRLNNHRHFLREWRIYRGLTQDELASRIGTSSGVIAAWDTVDRGIKLQDRFGCLRRCGSDQRSSFNGLPRHKRTRCVDAGHWRTGQTDPLQTYKISPVNGRNARESGPWLKAWIAPTRPLQQRDRQLESHFAFAVLLGAWTAA